MRSLSLAAATVLLTACGGGNPNLSLTTESASVLPVVAVMADQAMENAGPLRFRVTVNPAVNRAISVHYATRDGSALAGSDYVATSGVLHFAPGQGVAEVPVTLIDNQRVGGDKTLMLALSDTSNAKLASNASAVGSIYDDETPPSVTVSNPTVTEGQIGDSHVLAFNLRLSRAADQPVTLSYATQDDTAHAGQDYSASSGSLSFAVGESLKTLSVSVNGDEDVEADERLFLRIRDVVNANFGGADAVGTIVNDDAQRSFSVDDAAAAENAGPLVFAVRLSQASGKARSVRYATLDGSAQSGHEYTATSGTLNFAAGVISQNVSVALIDDAQPGPTKSMSLQLTANDDTPLANDSGLGTITDSGAGSSSSGGSSSGSSSSSGGGTAAPNMDTDVLADMATFNRCDFLDPHYCTFPWPNDWFTTANSATATGRQVNMNLLSMPKNSAGKPLDPTEWNRNDGFSVGQLILVRVPGLDLKKTGAVPITNIADSYRDDQPVVVIDAGPAKPVASSFKPVRHLIWSELDANLSKFTSCSGTKPLESGLGLAADSGASGAEQLKQQAAALRARCAANPTPEDPTVDPGPALTVRPAVNFTPGHRYIVALRRLKDGSGTLIAAPPAFRIYRDKAPTNLPMVEGRRAHFEELFGTLTQAGIARSDLYMAWDFTVISDSNLYERVVHIRDDALAKLGDTTPGDGIVQGNAPVFSITSVTNRAGSDNTAREVRGVVTVPSYLDQPRGVAGSKFYYAPSTAGVHGDNLPHINPITPTQQFDFLCRIPRRAFNGASDPASATVGSAQRPALYGHGLLGSKSEGGGQIGDIIQELGMVYCATDWIGMASHDSGVDSPDTVYFDPPFGDVANVATLLTDMSNFASLTDRLQQSFINFTYLGRAILNAKGFCSNAAFKVGNTCLLDRSNLYYDGNSQGGIFGGSLTAINPDIHAATLGVPGMNYSTLLQRSVDFDQYAAFLYASYRGSLDQQFVLSFIQMLWDRSDNNGYAHHLKFGNPLPGSPDRRPVMLHPAFGDHQVSMWTAEVMARTIGAQVHCPAVVSGNSPQRGPAVLLGRHPAVGIDPLDFDRRHPDDEPYYAIPCINAYPYRGNALVVWDSGPTKHEDGSPRNDDDGNPSGVAPPPIDNRPPRPELGYGGDPHGFPRSSPQSRQMKDALYQADGVIVDTCGGKPCATRGFNPQP